MHPHPARGGDMHSPFVVQCVQLCRRHGISTLRFDFSVPDGWHLREATDELLHANSRELASAIAMLRLRAPAAQVILAGYSWGALVGLAVARQEPSSVQALALIAPPIDFVPEALGPSRRDFALWPMLLACGETDESTAAPRGSRALPPPMLPPLSSSRVSGISCRVRARRRRPATPSTGCLLYICLSTDRHAM